MSLLSFHLKEVKETSKRISRRRAVAVFFVVVVLASSLFSLSLVQGVQPPNAGQIENGPLADIEASLNTLEEDVNNLQTQLNDEMTAIGNTNGALAAKTANLQSQINNINAAMEDLNTWVGNLDALIDNNYKDLKARIDGAQIALDNLQTQVSNLQTWLGNLATSTDSNLQTVNSILNDLVNAQATLNTWVGNLDALIDSNQQNLQNQIDSLQSQVDSLNTKVPRNGTIVIPAASFVALGTSNIIHARTAVYTTDTPYAIAEAGLQLPSGATLTRITFYWYDNGEKTIILQLWRLNSTSSDRPVMPPLVSNSGGYGFTTQPLSYTVDANSCYYLTLQIPTTITTAPGYSYQFRYAVIEYEYQP